jgi:uncharacterized hydrophobic protein (TIGR00271 family)
MLLICSSSIASLALLINSESVTIGAMIIAPLMNPIQSLSFSLVNDDWQLLRKSAFTLGAGIILTIAVAVFFNLITPFDVLDSEIVSRTNPGLTDLMIAVFAGLAGSYAAIRKDIPTSIAGVAIAVALVPPLCVAGIALGATKDITTAFGYGQLTRWHVASGSFLLFLSNFIGIMISSYSVLVFNGYGNWQRLRKSVFTLLIGLLVISWPLSISGRNALAKNLVSQELRQIIASYSNVLSSYQVRSVRVQLHHQQALVTILANAPAASITDEYLDVTTNRLLTVLVPLGVREVDTTLRLSHATIFRGSASLARSRR